LDEGPRHGIKGNNPVAERVVYPAGAVYLDGGRWLVSYGLHDGLCVVRVLDHGELISKVSRIVYS